jgi:N-acetylglutamate synthase-like GNAT family acetyltransferase
MTPADFPAVVAMADDAAAQALVGRPLWETAADVAADLNAPGRQAFVVAEEDDGAVVGMAGYRLLPSGEAELYGPLVTAEGHGIGVWLENRVTAMAAAEGATAFSLLIGVANRSGAAWAEWRGYLRDSEAPSLLLTWLYPGELRAAAAAPAGAIVRPAVAGDLLRIEALLQECFPQRREPLDGALSHLWVVESEGELAGCLRLDPNTAWIDRFCIDPARRRRGLGAHLLATAVSRFWTTQPARKVGLAVDLEDSAPVALLRRLGFRREVAVARWIKR